MEKEYFDSINKTYKNDIEILMEQKLIDPSRITYNLNVR